MPDSEKHQRNFPDILGGLIFISGGVILLLNNFGNVPWSIWTYIVRFWPVVFVFIGLDLISENSYGFKLITTLIEFAAVIFIIVYSYSAVSFNFRSYLFKNYPIWKKIYQIVPNSPGNSKYQTPNYYRIPIESGYFYSN